jgi:hypothetical protein
MAKIKHQPLQRDIEGQTTLSTNLDIIQKARYLTFTTLVVGY